MENYSLIFSSVKEEKVNTRCTKQKQKACQSKLSFFFFWTVMEKKQKSVGNLVE